MKKSTIRNYLKVLFAGILHAMKGAFAIVAAFLSVLLYMEAATVTGYFAIGEFIAATLLVVVAILTFYNCGIDLMKGVFSK